MTDLTPTSKTSLKWKIGGTLAAGLALAGMYSWAQNMPTTEKGAPPTLSVDQLEAKIGPDIVIAMTRAGYRKTYDKLGKRQFDNANALMRWAAIAAAESDFCQKVEVVGISDSATRKALRWYVDCSNGERFVIGEEQAVAARDQYNPSATADARSRAEQVAVAQPKSARWANFNEANTVSACDLTVQQAMLVPRTFSTGWSKWQMAKNDETGVVTIERDYKAENAYSMKINGRYRCSVDTDAAKITGLSIREPDGWKKLI